MQDTESLFCRYRDDVYRLAVSYTRNIQEAEDICQSVFLRLLEQKHIQPGKEKAWLMQVTANQCRSLLRSGWWKRTVPLEDTLTIPAAQTDDTLRTVMALPPKYRVVIYLYYYEERSAKEIASLLRITPTTVTTRLSRARKILKTKLMEV